jgi:hypothetical protein
MKKQILCSGLLMLSCICTLPTYGQGLGFDRHISARNSQPLDAPAMAIAPDGRIYNAHISGNNIVVTVSHDHGKSWLPLQSIAINGYSLACPSVIVSGDKAAGLSLFIAGIARSAHSAGQSVFVQQYDAETGMLISERFRQSIPGIVYSCDLAAGSTHSGEQSISLLYAADFGTARMLLQKTSVDGGKSFAVSNTVASSQGYFRNVSIDYGISEHASNGRYFMAWDEYISPKAAWGKVYTSRNVSSVMSATIKPVEVNPAMAGKLRRPALAVSHTSAGDGALSCTAVLLAEYAANENGEGVAICGFSNPRSHFSNYWTTSILCESGSQPAIAFDPAHNSFAASFYNPADKSMHLAKRTGTADKWESVAVNYADVADLQDPKPCIVIDPLYQQAAMSWVSDAGYTLCFDAEYNKAASSLQQIEAHNDGSYNRVTWTAGDAEDKGAAVIERSTDNLTFSPLATVLQEGAPFSNQFNDPAPHKGMNYYRIKFSTRYSATVSAYADAAGQDGLCVYPNPATRYLTIATPSATAQAVITVYTLTGKQCMSRPATGNTTIIDLNGLPGGTYLVEYTNGNERKASRVTKVLP